VVLYHTSSVPGPFNIGLETKTSRIALPEYCILESGSNHANNYLPKTGTDVAVNLSGVGHGILKKKNDEKTYNEPS